MAHPTIRYMEWAKTVAPVAGEGALNCASTDLELLRPTVRDLIGADPGGLPLSGDGAYGHRALREAIGRRYRVDPACVFPTQGASTGNYVLFAGLLDRGDTVLVEEPAYEPLFAAPAALGGRVVRFRRREENRWALAVEEIARLARDERARLIVISNPHNPTGEFTRDGELVQLAEEVAPDTVVLVDEIYREWGPDEAGRTIALQRPNLAATSSLTKVYGLSRLRAGWLIANESLIHKASRAFDHIGVVGPAPLETVTARFLDDTERLESLRDESTRRALEGRETLTEWIAGERRAHGAIPPFTGYLPLRMDGFGRERPLAEWLLNEHRVLAVPGRFFGLGDAYVRLAWMQSRTTARDLIERLRDGAGD